jgi:maltooligosyltrehalose trehalohydrolase
MPLLPLNKIGALETAPGVITFGLYLPNVTAGTGLSVSLKIIHEADQFVQTIQPFPFPLVITADPDFPNGDYWTATVDTSVVPPGAVLPADAHWGDPGKYVYRFLVTKLDGTVIDFIVDPYAREYGVGDLSGITLGAAPYAWSPQETKWKVPAQQDMIFYEIMIDEFGGDIDGTIKLLDYLQDLGINCIEVMPVNDVKSTVNWGYDPFGYFGVDDRFGSQADFQRFVDAAHQHGIAVVLDVAYGHTTGDFTFPYLYPQIGVANPYNGPVIHDAGYGPMPDFSQTFTQDYFFTANKIWLEAFHVDGFRYDNVPAFWDSSNPNTGYGQLVTETYNLVQAQMATPGAPNYWQRFQSASGFNLIQCAEYLNDPPAVLNNTLTTCTWQDWTLSAGGDCASGKPGAISELGQRLGLQYFPTVATVNGITLPKAGLQYIENHDHSRFICEFGIQNPGDPNTLWHGDPGNWYHLQPYLIGLLTAKGIPLLWEGQEFLQTYSVPNNGNGRQLVLRPVDFSSFYDVDGKALIAKVRTLIKIRKTYEQFRSGDHSFFDVPYYTNSGLLVFSRSLGAAYSLVALNFTGSPQTTTITLPTSGNYAELLDGVNNLAGVAAGVATTVTIPSNYGQVWTLE